MHKHCNCSKENLWRPAKIILVNRILQVLTFLGIGQWAYYGVFRCPFFVPYINCQNCPVITCHGRLFSLFWGVWAGWFALAIFCGRAFCGWFCPGGFVNRVLGYFAPLKVKASSFLGQNLPAFKVMAILVCLWGYFGLGQPRMIPPIRVGEIWLALQQTFEFASFGWIIRTGIVIAILALGIIIPAAWCRFGCPAGGVLEIVKRYSLFAVKKTDECNNCDLCRKACYMQTRPQEVDCTNCGDCIHSCPSKCIGIGRNK